jgi:hypothetical protein
MGFWSDFLNVTKKVAPIAFQFALPMPIGELNVGELNEIFRIMCKAHGPDGILHFSELSADEQAELLRVAPAYAGTHRDWPPGLSDVPRTCTLFVLPKGTHWPVLEGNATSEKPIPDPGQWYMKRGFFTMTTLNRVHIREGFRPNDVDSAKSDKWDIIDWPSVAFKKV